MDSDCNAFSATPSTAMAEQPTSNTATSLKETSVADNLLWASVIKEQHRHLQGAVAVTGVPPPEQRKETESVSTTGVTSFSPLPYERDLQAWRSALDGTEAARRLSAYSTAMHHLATQYWDPLPSTAVATTDNNVVSSEASVEGRPCKDPQSATQSNLHGTLSTPSIGEKRSRNAFDASNKNNEIIGTPKDTTSAVGEATKAPQHYSDRLQYCLKSTASYFLGETVSTTQAIELSVSADAHREKQSEHNGASSLETNVADAERQQHRHKQTPQLLLIPVHDTTFSRLPGAMARVVKPLRRVFFDLYGRMATGEEVGQLIQACTAGDVLPHSAAADAFASSVLTTSSNISSRSENGATLVETLIRTHPEGQRIHDDSSWRRGVDTAWAAALRYTLASPTPIAKKNNCHSAAAPSLPPPPLYVLDVGSCYGPFHGKVLSRPSPLPPVPLRVTSMDLAPYLDGAPAGLLHEARAPPAPRVWQGDWLCMEFFGGESTNDFPDGHEGMGAAEDGRVRYRVPSKSDTCTPSKPSSCNGNSKAPVRDDAGAVSSAASSQAAPLVVTALRFESYDTVFFCLLLSYMPTPRLRFLACLHACLALKEGGLLVIVSTRTQGPRRRNWMQEWTTCLATIGFQRVEQTTQEKIVGMTFAKVCPSKEVHDSWTTKEGRKSWIRAMMSTAAAENGLRITADNVQNQTDI